MVSIGEVDEECLLDMHAQPVSRLQMSLVPVLESLSLSPWSSNLGTAQHDRSESSQARPQISTGDPSTKIDRMTEWLYEKSVNFARGGIRCMRYKLSLETTASRRKEHDDQMNMTAADTAKRLDKPTKAKTVEAPLVGEADGAEVEADCAPELEAEALAPPVMVDAPAEVAEGAAVEYAANSSV